MPTPTPVTGQAKSQQPKEPGALTVPGKPAINPAIPAADEIKRLADALAEHPAPPLREHHPANSIDGSAPRRGVNARWEQFDL